MSRPVPLLLLPGLLCDGALWAPQISALGAVAACTVADLTLDSDVEAMARRALAAMPARFAVAGLSMGGYVAFALLRLAPERVSRLMLIATSARPDDPARARRRRGLMALASRGQVFRGVTPRLLPSLLHADALADAALGEGVMAMAARVGREAYLRQQQAILTRPDSRAGLAAIHVPCEIIVGAADGETPPERAREMAALIPGSRLHVLPACGHLPPLEKPAEVSRLMLAWLHEEGPEEDPPP